MNQGIVYLVQPCELIGTNRYKLGCSEEPDLNRIKGYKKGTRYISIMECTDPFKLEKELKIHFNKDFKLIAGREFFEGDVNAMRCKFNEIVLKYYKDCQNNNNGGKIVNDTISGVNIDGNDNNDNNKDSDNEDSDTDDDYISDDLKNIFTNWREDVRFGGKKQLLKIKINNAEYVMMYIDNKDLKELTIHVKDSYDENFESFILNLESNKIIENDCIYDMNDEKFLKKLDKYKKKISVKLSDKQILHSEKIILCTMMKNKPLTTFGKIKKYLCHNTILNDNIYCNENNNNLDIDKISNFSVTIKKIGNQYYDSDYLREYIPYLIELNNNDEFYIVNRDYYYIGLNIKINPCRNDEIQWKRIYAYDYETSPLLMEDTTKSFKQYIIKYNKMIQNKICLNDNHKTKVLLNYK